MQNLPRVALRFRLEDRPFQRPLLFAPPGRRPQQGRWMEYECCGEGFVFASMVNFNWLILIDSGCIRWQKGSHKGSSSGRSRFQGSASGHVNNQHRYFGNSIIGGDGENNLINRIIRFHRYIRDEVLAYLISRQLTKFECLSSKR